MRKGEPVARALIAAYTKRFTRRRPRIIPGFKTGRFCAKFSLPPRSGRGKIRAGA